MAESMELTPAYNRDERVAVWIAMDIRFEPVEEGPFDADGPPASAVGDASG